MSPQRASEEQQDGGMARAILTDTHFWVPFLVLLLGLLVLVICTRA